MESAVIVAANATFEVPSKEMVGAVTKSPVILKSLAVAREVAVPALPCISVKYCLHILLLHLWCHYCLK